MPPRAKPERVYLFDIYQQTMTVNQMFKDAERYLERETWQYYLEWMLVRDCGINVVRTVSFNQHIAPFVRYLDWKLSKDAPLIDLFPEEVVSAHRSEECWVYRDGTNMLIVYY